MKSFQHRPLLLSLLITFVSGAVQRFEVDYASPIPYKHGVVAWLSSKNDCSIQARNVDDGSLLWEQRLCSGQSDKHQTAVTKDGVYTYDNGKVKSWDAGGLKSEVDVLSELNDPNDKNPFVVDKPTLFAAETSSGTVLGTIITKGKKEGLVLVDSTGKIIKTASGQDAISARKLLNEAKRKPIKYARVLGLVSSGDRLGIVTAYTDDQYFGLHSLAYSDIKISSNHDGLVYEMTNTVALKTAEVSKSEIIPGSVKVWADKSRVYLIGFVKYASRTSLSGFDTDTGNGNEKEISMGDLYYSMLWLDGSTIDGTTDSGRIIRVAGQDGRLPKEYRTESLLMIGDDEYGAVTFKKFSHENEEDDVQTEALVYCPEMNVAIAASSDSDGVTALATYQTSADHVTWSNVKFVGNTTLVFNASDGSSRGLPEFAHLVKCDADSMTVVVTAQGGIAVGFRVDKKDSALVVTKLWSTEEDIEKSTVGTDEL